MTPPLPAVVSHLLEYVNYDQHARAALRGYALSVRPSDRALAGWITTFLSSLPPVRRAAP